MASSFIYRTFFQRNATFWASIFSTAFVAEMVFDSGVDKVFDRINRGVSSFSKFLVALLSVFRERFPLCQSPASLFTNFCCLETMERYR